MKIILKNCFLRIVFQKFPNKSYIFFNLGETTHFGICYISLHQNDFEIAFLADNNILDHIFYSYQWSWLLECIEDQMKVDARMNSCETPICFLPNTFLSLPINTRKVKSSNFKESFAREGTFSPFIHPMTKESCPDLLLMPFLSHLRADSQLNACQNLIYPSFKNL